MNDLRLFENEKKLLLVQLDLKYSNFTVETLSEIADSLEFFLKDYATASLKRTSKEFLTLEIAKDGMFLVDDNLNYYELTLSEDLNDPHLLIIFIRAKDTQRKYSLEKHGFALSGCFGKYFSFTFMFPKKLRIKKRSVEELIKIIFECGYDWFYEKTIQLAKEQENKLGYRLYDYAKTIIHPKELLRNLWFASITEGFGFRLLNATVVEQSFNLIQKNVHEFRQSTNSFVAELLNTKLPEDKLLMINAIKQKDSIDANLKNAKYKKTDSFYAVTLKALYGQNYFTVHPIFESDKFCIVALFDTKDKNQITPLFDLHKKDFEDICQESIGGVRALLRKLKEGAKYIVTNIFDIFEFKPEIFGIGIDIKVILEKLNRKQLPK
jgi:hypothetical protein